MGDVAIKMKVMPESPETDLEKIKTEIAGIVKIQDSKIEPIAFGLNSLNILFIIPDSEGAKADEVAEKIKKIEGVTNAEVESVTLL
ncbi:MAG: elongation factor 1-beta [Candidatus Aenigmarchaeota archaeon]|nr:elongation factor 1-beta [Candidatus Aenigmarchaeota archaeon]